MPPKFEIKGLKELQIKLQKLDPAVGGKVLRAAALTAMNPVVRQARGRIPVNDRDYVQTTYKGRPVFPGFAKRSIAKKAIVSKDKRFVKVMVGVKPEAFYAVTFVELGTSKQARQPWLEPALRRNRGSMTKNMERALRRRILKVASQR